MNNAISRTLAGLVLAAFASVSAAQGGSQVITRCDCGTVESITPRTVETTGGNTTMGTIAGAIVGGVVGHQFGGGKGKGAMTAAGAVGGAAAGNKIAGSRGGTQEVYDVAVRMDYGGVRNFTINDASQLRPGDHVNIADGRVARF